MPTPQLELRGPPSLLERVDAFARSCSSRQRRVRTVPRMCACFVRRILAAPCAVDVPPGLIHLVSGTVYRSPSPQPLFLSALGSQQRTWRCGTGTGVFELCFPFSSSSYLHLHLPTAAARVVIWTVIRCGHSHWCRAASRFPTLERMGLGIRAPSSRGVCRAWFCGTRTRGARVGRGVQVLRMYELDVRGVEVDVPAGAACFAGGMRCARRCGCAYVRPQRAEVDVRGVEVDVRAGSWGAGIGNVRAGAASGVSTGCGFHRRACGVRAKGMSGVPTLPVCSGVSVLGEWGGKLVRVRRLRVMLPMSFSRRRLDRILDAKGEERATRTPTLILP
ncbi:hypothetical protein B0H16DRAFT_1738316 [Mycena metata]|uniref:Uncharacterized protein n=1 Tax=Mycena metata TaxID=1033252 RepID=A0AAD7MK69_9AGAR|nr:hypothetical protein B0H16DRAFT_1738316 [Mycena metata]